MMTSKTYLKNYPAISIKMLSVLAKRLSISEQQSTWMSTETSKERLMNFLIRSATLNKSGEMVVYLPMPKKDLASYLGTTPETLSRQFTILKKDGVITQSSNNYIKINGLSHKDITCEIC